MVLNIKSIQNFILFLSICVLMYVFSMKTFLSTESPIAFPIITISMSAVLTILIITDLKLRGMYLSEIIGLFKPKQITKKQLALVAYISLILCGLLVLAKFIIVNYFIYYFPFSSYHIQLFSPKINLFNKMLLVSISVYTLTCVFQEFIARAWLQDSFSLIFHNKVTTILMTSAYFGASHLHMTPYIAILVFMLSIGWGSLYFMTKRSLYCVAISHAIVGIFAFNVLGVPFELVYGPISQ